MARLVWPGWNGTVGMAQLEREGAAARREYPIRGGWPAANGSDTRVAMRLTCPNCGAEYDVPEGLIPPAGKHVQCTACHTRWFMRGQAREELSEDQILRKLETRGSGAKPAALPGGASAAPIAFPAAGGARRDAASRGAPVRDAQSEGAAGGETAGGETVRRETAGQNVAGAPGSDKRPESVPPDDGAPFNWQSPESPNRDPSVFAGAEGDRDRAEARPDTAREAGPPDRPADPRMEPFLKRSAAEPAGGTAARKTDGTTTERAEPRPSIPAPRRDPAPSTRDPGGLAIGGQDPGGGAGRGADRETDPQTGRDASEEDLAAPRIALREAPRTAPPRLDVADHRGEATPPPRAKRRFLPGFILALLIAGLALEIYVWRDPLADQIPAAAPAIDGYANAVDAAREWLRDRLGGAQDGQPG